MLDALWNRLRSKPQVTRPPASGARVTRSPPATVQPAPGTALPVPAGTGARRPLVSAQGRLAGFEFRAGGAAFDRLQGPAIAACTANLLGAMRLCAGQGMGALSELPAGWLAAVPETQFAQGMHLSLRADASCQDIDATCALVNKLRRAGARAGWNPLATPALPAAAGRPDFVPLPAMPGADAQAWRAAVQAAAARWPGMPLALLELPSVEAMEAVLAPPVAWAACSIGGCAEPARAQALPPQAQRALQLMNRLLHDEDHDAVVADIKSDAALSLRLLQYLNSAGALPGRELESIDQAVMLVGRNALYRWVAQMLVRMSPPRPAAHALQSSALARARLFELLARRTDTANPGGLYLLGLATMLPMLLQCGIDEAAEAMHLPPQAAQALRRQGGPWQRYVDLLPALEAGDLPRLDALSMPFGGQEQVLACWTEAWQPA